MSHAANTGDAVPFDASLSMPQISVVVPIYNVEKYLPACLQSLACQTVRDLEVILVDDGSTDRCVAIAEHFCRADRRFRLLRQDNAGLGAARNAGIAAASGEHLAFLDSDDVLPANAYELLLGALRESGSDFATGNVQRLTSRGCTQAQFLARTFARTRLRTHVTRFAPLLADRTVWNKLWRRSFWDEHDLRFPEGVVHEDIPVTIPAHFLARSVDVVAAPVYRWRLREDGAHSITQRRLEHAVLRDRLGAVDQVRAFLAEHAPPALRRRYDERLVADDLRLHLDVLDEADDAYRSMFVERANAILDDARSDLCDDLPAIDRLKWHLVRRRLVGELLDVLRFQKRAQTSMPAVRRRGRWYGDFPHRLDAELAIPRSVFRLGRTDQELALTAWIDELGTRDGRIVVGGSAQINGLRMERVQRLGLRALRRGRWRAIRLRLCALRLATSSDAAGTFSAALDPVGLRFARRGQRSGRWELFARLRARGIVRRRARFEVDPGLRPIQLRRADGALVTAHVSDAGALLVEVQRAWLQATHHRLTGSTLEIAGDAQLSQATSGFVLRRRSDGLVLHHRLDVAGAAFTGCIPLSGLLASPPSLEAQATTHREHAEVWELAAQCEGRTMPIRLADGLAGSVLTSGARAVELVAGPCAEALLVDRPHAVATAPAPVREAAPAAVA